MKCCTRSKGVLHHDVKVFDEIDSLKCLSILKLLCNCTKWIPKNPKEKKIIGEKLKKRALPWARSKISMKKIGPKKTRRVKKNGP